MKIDFYTKAMLTIIAACLVYFCFGKPPVVQAQGEPRVLLAGWVDWKNHIHWFAPGDVSSALPVRTEN